MQINLNARQQNILWATVRSYIATAEPVGSKTLAQSYDLGVSTATIRNVMAVLERSGLLFQPHTSAGRIPSDNGYRVYVDDLIEDPTDLQEQLLQVLSDRLGQQLNDNLETLLHQATQILATLSGCIALVTAPPTDTATIRHLQLVAVDRNRIMAILVTDSYQSHSVLLNLQSDSQTGLGSPLGHTIAPLSPVNDDRRTEPDAIEQLEQELQLLNNFLNLQLRGKTFYDILNIDWSELNRQFRSYGAWLQQLLDVLKHNHLRPAIGQVFVGGMTGLMRQPEFAQTDQIQDVVQLLEENQSELWPVLGPTSPDRVVVYIGSENPLEPMRQCSLISTGYSCGSWAMGSVSLLGPTRLPYERAIASVKATAHHLSNTLNSVNST
ncbi:heat-inducible transcriptional repressor HrcA [Synechococcus sp. PCC 7336]|uniref:HrcA family transcriptional regulator n=1 Tax=Synechococcus sp. PCC 7336 TaxID=195250 RepID=UPI000346E9CD|nr:heat-inducible transcriptional repressor HrcA [Synechococcus sp. PCC 7336]